MWARADRRAAAQCVLAAALIRSRCSTPCAENTRQNPSRLGPARSRIAVHGALESCHRHFVVGARQAPEMRAPGHGSQARGRLPQRVGANALLPGGAARWPRRRCRCKSCARSMSSTSGRTGPDGPRSWRRRAVRDAQHLLAQRCPPAIAHARTPCFTSTVRPCR
jgi:hypothetical protein